MQQTHSCDEVIEAGWERGIRVLEALDPDLDISTFRQVCETMRHDMRREAWMQRRYGQHLIPAQIAAMIQGVKMTGSSLARVVGYEKALALIAHYWADRNHAAECSVAATG